VHRAWAGVRSRPPPHASSCRHATVEVTTGGARPPLARRSPTCRARHSHCLLSHRAPPPPGAASAGGTVASTGPPGDLAEAEWPRTRVAVVAATTGGDADAAAMAVAVRGCERAHFARRAAGAARWGSGAIAQPRAPTLRGCGPTPLPPRAHPTPNNAPHRAAAGRRPARPARRARRDARAAARQPAAQAVSVLCGEVGVACALGVRPRRQHRRGRALGAGRRAAVVRAGGGRAPSAPTRPRHGPWVELYPPGGDHGRGSPVRDRRRPRHWPPTSPSPSPHLPAPKWSSSRNPPTTCATP